MGSRVGPSSFVEIPWEAVQVGRGPPGGAAAALPWEVLQAAQAGIDSLAPIRSAAMVPDPSGCSDQRLLMSCGSGASGRLGLARWAASLVPQVSGGPTMLVGRATRPLLLAACSGGA